MTEGNGSPDRAHDPGYSVGGGRFAENILFFARTLRAAGLPVGPGKTLDAVRAAEAVGIERRDDFYWALHAVFVNRRDQQEIFDQTFHMFWRNPRILERMMGMVLPEIADSSAKPMEKEQINRRVAEAFNKEPGSSESEGEPQEKEELEIDAALTFSARELLQEMDFEQMSAEEIEEAKRAIQTMRLPLQEIRTRRYRPNRRGSRADLRASLRQALKGGGDIIPLRWKERQLRRPPLVILCDISGSMAQYSRMVMHFMHRLTNDRDRVHSFVFGTRLTNITRPLRNRDIDLALDKISEEVVDWSGGTRIGACLHDFNRNWSRRVLGQGAVVLLITDGLDREGAEGLDEEMERLHKSCRRLIWLNPLLRYEGYAPKSMGAQAMIHHVDELRTVHNLKGLKDLAEALGEQTPGKRKEMSEWLEKSA
jgi:uncharacterized protein with von Willebrand factor type A (vWA) domain